MIGGVTLTHLCGLPGPLGTVTLSAGVAFCHAKLGLPTLLGSRSCYICKRTKTDRMIKYLHGSFFHSLSGKIPLNKLSHHCSVLPQFLHILYRRRFILIRNHGHATAVLYCCITWTVNCLWRRIWIIKSDNKKPQHWNAPARAASERKRALTPKTRCSSAVLSVNMLSDHTTTCRNFTPDPAVVRLYVIAGHFSTAARRLTSPTWGPQPPCKEALHR